ncbi:hypothetical protein NEOC95_001000 [Neochlamydia sp. AcF95]|nr:hypothetical protein [Neochlamydia sp. AcF95]
MLRNKLAKIKKFYWWQQNLNISQCLNDDKKFFHFTSLV